MNFFGEKSPSESEAPIEKEGSKESSISRFTGWLGKKLRNADEAISAEVSPEGGEIGKAVDRLLNLKREDYRNAAFGLGCTSLAAALLLNGGRMALSAAIPGMENMAFSGINPDDLASIPGSIIDSLGHALGMGGHIDAGSVTPPVDVPVTPEHAAPAPVPQEWSDGTDGDYQPNRPSQVLYEKPIGGDGDNASILFKKEGTGFVLGKDSLNPGGTDGSAEFKKVIDSMHEGSGANPNLNAETGAFGDGAAETNADPNIDKAAAETASTGASADAAAGKASPETIAEEHARTLEDGVKSAFTPGTSEEHARTLEDGVKSAFTPGTSEENAKDINAGVESHFGKSAAPVETGKNIETNVKSAFTPGTAEEHAKKITESIFKGKA